MILSQEAWMELRVFRALAEAGATWAEIARETGHDWRTVKRYLSADASSSPPAPARRGPGRRKIDPYAHLVDGWLAKQPKLKAVTIYERLVAEHGFDGHYQRVKVYVRENRERVVGIPADPPDLHRRFEVLAGAQAQVDWGDEGEVQTAGGPLHAFSFHMVLSYSRDPFCCDVASQDLATFWDCHRRGFAHFGGVPAAIVYDRTKTVVRRHVGRGQATPLHPEAVAFASHYQFAVRLCAPRRPQAKGRVERQVRIVRTHVLDGREFDSLGAMDQAFLAWLPHRRAAVHRTHGEVIAVGAERDRAALSPLPERPYVVCDRHTRRVAKDCLVSFEASCYSVPGARSGPASESSCGSRRPRWRSGRWAAGHTCSPPTLGRPAAASGRSTRPTGTDSRARLSRCHRAPATASSRPSQHPSRDSSPCPSWPAGPGCRRPGSRSPAAPWPPTTWSEAWHERADRHPRARAC
jgi:transposase